MAVGSSQHGPERLTEVKIFESACDMLLDLLLFPRAALHSAFENGILRPGGDL